MSRFAEMLAVLWVSLPTAAAGQSLCEGDAECPDAYGYPGCCLPNGTCSHVGQFGCTGRPTSCGESTCFGVDHPFGAIKSCCLEDGGCGVELYDLYFHDRALGDRPSDPPQTCESYDQPGNLEPRCPSYEVHGWSRPFLGPTMLGCCRADGRCGVWIGDVPVTYGHRLPDGETVQWREGVAHFGLGCVDVAPFHLDPREISSCTPGVPEPTPPRKGEGELAPPLPIADAGAQDGGWPGANLAVPIEGSGGDDVPDGSVPERAGGSGAASEGATFGPDADAERDVSRRGEGEAVHGGGGCRLAWPGRSTPAMGPLCAALLLLVTRRRMRPRPRLGHGPPA